MRQVAGIPFNRSRPRYAELFLVLLLSYATGGIQAQVQAPSAWKPRALEVVAWFETKDASWNTVAPDFDCNGVSVGILQWNIGTGSLKDLLNRFSASSSQLYMPTFGAEFIKKVNESKNAGLDYVRRLQKFKQPSICNANKRGAAWNVRGELFRRELVALISSEDGLRNQTALSDVAADAAWTLAVEWSNDKRGTSSPTFGEFVYFYNTHNFSGDFWRKIANYEAVSALKKQGDLNAYNEAIGFLRRERCYVKNGHCYPYLQIWEADQNVALWKDRVPNVDELDLFLHAYLVAKHITKLSKEKGKADPIQFRLNSFSRAGTVIFNDGYVNKTHKSFPQLNPVP